LGLGTTARLWLIAGWQRPFDDTPRLPRPENAKVSDVLEHLNET
jgi:hypothetical protein